MENKLEINAYYRLNMSVLSTVKIIKIINDKSCVVDYVGNPNLINCTLDISLINLKKLNSYEILNDIFELKLQQIGLKMLRGSRDNYEKFKSKIMEYFQQVLRN